MPRPRPFARRAMPFTIGAVVLAGAVVIAAQSSPQTATGTLEPMAPMSEARASHTATVLPTGQVLLAGRMTAEENTAAGADRRVW